MRDLPDKTDSAAPNGGGSHPPWVTCRIGIQGIVAVVKPQGEE